MTTNRKIQASDFCINGHMIEENVDVSERDCQLIERNGV